MTNKFIYHHLGLGDHIICNGLVRYLYSKNKSDNISLFCKPHYFSSVAFMYKDLDNLQIVKADDIKVRQLIKFFDGGIIVGHEHLRFEPGLTFDELFYKQLGVPFYSRWDAFKVVRDLSREEDVFKRLALAEPYAFIHDDPGRGLIIDRSRIAEGLKHIHPSQVKTDNIFDYMTVMENATEVHCMDSSFKLMFDSCASKAGALFYHINLVNNVRRPDVSKSKLNWQMI